MLLLLGLKSTATAAAALLPLFGRSAAATITVLPSVLGDQFICCSYYCRTSATVPDTQQPLPGRWLNLFSSFPLYRARRSCLCDVRRRTRTSTMYYLCSCSPALPDALGIHGLQRRSSSSFSRRRREEESRRKRKSSETTEFTYNRVSATARQQRNKPLCFHVGM